MFSLQAIIEVIISYKEKPVLVGDNHIRLPQFPLSNSLLAQMLHPLPWQMTGTSSLLSHQKLHFATLCNFYQSDGKK